MPPSQKNKPTLNRSVSLFQATMYGIGVTLGAGIYALVGEAAGIAGNALWLSFIFSGLIASFTALSYAELSSMFPKESAEFLYIKKAFGREWFAFLIAWVSIVVGFISIAAVSLGFARYFGHLVRLFAPNIVLPIAVFAVAQIAILSLINFAGISKSARINTIFSIIEVAGLVIIILIGLPFLGSVNYFSVSGAVEPLFSLISPITVAASLIFFAYIGFEELANITEETKNATKAIPKAVLLSLIISTILYVLVALTVVSVVPWGELAASEAPLSLVAEKAFSSNAGLALTLIAIISTTNTVLVLLLAVSRRFYGVSMEHCLPNFLHRIHPKTRTPHYAIVATFFLAFLFVLSQNIKAVAFLTDFGIFLIFLVVNIAVIFLRYSSPATKRPFKIPFNIGRFPVTAFFGVLTCAYMLFSFSWEIVVASIAIFLFSLLFYRTFRERFRTK